MLPKLNESIHLGIERPVTSCLDFNTIELDLLYDHCY